MRKLKTLADIPAFPISATPSELTALLEKLPDFPLEPDVDEQRLLEALATSTTLAELLKNIYPSQAGVVFAAGALAKQNIAHEEYTVGASEIRQSSKLPSDGHVGVVGDLTVEGDLDVAATLVVTGDLTVHGALSDCGPDSRVVVHGDMICDHLFTDGWILVGGDVRVKGIIYGSYNDDALEVLGDIEAGIILTHDHAIDPAGQFRVKHEPETQSVWGDQPVFDVYSNDEHVAAVKKLLGDNILDEDNELAYAVARRVKL